MTHRAALIACAILLLQQWAPADNPAGGKVAMRDGRPVIITSDGRVMTSSYCERLPWYDRVHIRTQQMSSRGVDLFQWQLRGVGTPGSDYYDLPFWLDDGVYADDEGSIDRNNSLDECATRLLAEKPDAMICVSFFLAPPTAWVEKFPGEMQKSEDGKQWRAASYASERFQGGMKELIARIVRYCEGRPWGKNVVGYVAIPHTEGITEMSVFGHMFDQSDAMQGRFQQFLKGKYGSDDAFQKSWSDTKVSLATARVPLDSQWQNDRESWLTWPKPEQTGRYRDYFELQRDLLHIHMEKIARAVKSAAKQPAFVTIDALKQPLSGWPLIDCFEARGLGMDYPDILLASGSWDVGRTIDIPELDGFMTPADYTARSVGYGFEAEGLLDSLVLRGKLQMLEDDARSFAHEIFKDEQGAWRTLPEATAGLFRNTAMAASRGAFSHWANVSRGGYFDNEQVLSVIGNVARVRKSLFTTPLQPTEHCIAMIIDDESSIHTDFTCGFQQLAVIQQRVNELALTGIPYRIYLLSDLRRDDFPPFRMYLFPNLFRLDAERIELIRRKVLRSGAVALFGPGTGITDGTGYNVKQVSDFLGFPLELVEKKAARRVIVAAGSHPAMADVRSPIVYGDSFQFGPMLQPAFDLRESAAVELGKGTVWWNNNRAGLVMKEFGKGAAGSTAPGPRGDGDAAIVFSVAMPMPAAVLRSLALYAGCRPWSDLGDVVFANDGFVAIHSIRPGTRTIRVPEGSTVRDLVSGARVAENADRFTIELATPDTRLFEISTSHAKP